MDHAYLEQLRKDAPVIATWNFNEVLGNTIAERFASLEESIKRLSLAFTIKYESNPTILAGGLEVLSLIETSPKFESSYEEVNETIYKVGTWRGINVYRDNWFAVNSLIISDGKHSMAIEIKGLV